MMTSYSSNWLTVLLLCTSAALVLCYDRFDRGSRQVKREPVDLATEDYDVSFCQRILNLICRKASRGSMASRAYDLLTKSQCSFLKKKYIYLKKKIKKKKKKSKYMHKI